MLSVSLNSITDKFYHIMLKLFIINWVENVAAIISRAERRSPLSAVCAPPSLVTFEYAAYSTVGTVLLRTAIALFMTSNSAYYVLYSGENVDKLREKWLNAMLIQLVFGEPDGLK